MRFIVRFVMGLSIGLIGIGSAAGAVPAEMHSAMPPAVVVTEGGVPVRVVRQAASQDAAVSAGVSSGTSSGEVSVELQTETKGVQILNPALPAPSALTGAEVGRWAPRNKAVFVRNPAPFLDAAAREDALERIRLNQFGRVLIRFGSEETSALQEVELRNFLASATEKGLVVDLWTDVADLIGSDEGQAALEFFASFSFRGVLLDFDAAARPEQVAGVAATAREVFQRPVGVVLPEEWMSAHSSLPNAEALKGVEEIVLKVDSTDAEGTAVRFSSVCRAHPSLSFSLAQSVEADRPRTESYFMSGVTIFGQRMKKLCFDVSAANALDLIVRDWENYVEMGR